MDSKLMAKHAIMMFLKDLKHSDVDIVYFVEAF